MIRNEKEMERKLKKDFYRQNKIGLWKKMHGGMYQRDYPDTLISTKHKTVWAELKFERGRKSLPAGNVIFLKTTDGQAQTLTDLAVLQGPIKPYIIFGFTVPKIDSVGIIAAPWEKVPSIKYSINAVTNYFIKKGGGGKDMKQLFEGGSRVQIIMSMQSHFNLDFLLF